MSNTPFLDELFGARQVRRLLASHWPIQRNVGRISTACRRWLSELPELQSVHSVLAAWRGVVTVIMPYSDDDHGDEHNSISVPAKDAAKLYRAGMSIAFSNAEHLHPRLEHQLQGLAKDLGLPNDVVARCIVYASPADRGAAPHFDANANFAIQLRGRKRWGLAPNRHVAFPTDRYAIGMSDVPAKLASYVSMLPKEMPTDAEYVVVAPGDYVFIPRGTWHHTKAMTESLSINFTFSQPTWATFFMNALVPMLTREGQWRELADGVAAPGRRGADTERRVKELSTALASVLAGIEADALLGTQKSETKKFRRKPGTRLRIHATHARVTARGRDAVDMETDASLATVLRWIQQRSAMFDANTLFAVAPNLSGAERRALLGILVEAQVVEHVPDSLIQRSREGFRDIVEK